jgi:hypothetical protein
MNASKQRGVAPCPRGRPGPFPGWHRWVAKLTGCLLLISAPGLRAATDVYLLDVPDYRWEYGCFGTASGNLMGFWDRNGMSNFYTGPTAGGFAPLNSQGTNAGIRSLWASQAGFDGRPASLPGHVDNYYIEYERTDSDPFFAQGWPEHEPECTGDFIGLNQKKWTNMNNECDGNIDAYSFVFWDQTGNRRPNFQPTNALGQAVPDIPSGLRAWTRHRGYDAEVFSQLTDFNPTVSKGKGFTFEDLKAEINAGYPVLLFLQEFTHYSRAMPGMAKANPPIHGMLAFGYQTNGLGQKFVRYRTSWGSGDGWASEWTADEWQAGLPLRGVIGYRPKPRITCITPPAGGLVTIRWEGPGARLQNATLGTITEVHRYVIERSTTLAPGSFVQVAGPTTAREASVPVICGCLTTAFFRVRLVGP